MYYGFDKKTDRKETNSPMAILPQSELFSWEQVDASSDLKRLELMLSAIPDEPLMQALECERKGRRNDYPIRAIWNSILAGVVFQHCSIESLRRELLRNAELRQACGFSVLRGDWAVPPKYVYSRFRPASGHRFQGDRELGQGEGGSGCAAIDVSRSRRYHFLQSGRSRAVSKSRHRGGIEELRADDVRRIREIPWTLEISLPGESAGDHLRPTRDLQ